MERLSANQRYKQSGSKLTFTEWLENETKIGNLEDYRNADGDNEDEKKGDNTLTFVLVGVLALGLYLYYKKK
tara:strand:- start:2203 stop:2418 length:216 start_codon:yes stop_codon:yes gene_type:complete